MRPFLLGALIGLLVSFAGIGLFSARVTSKKLQEARAGWKLEPILTLARAIPEGEKLTDEDLVEIRIPEQYVPESFVLPADRRAIVGRPATLAMEKGDPLNWSSFSRQETRARVRDCVADGRAAYTEAGDRARDAAIQPFAQRNASPPTSPPPPVPAFQFDAKGLAPVVVVTREVKEGERIPASALELRKMPRALVTPSLVPGEALASVAGALAVVPMQPGDTLRWQFLDDPEQPRTLGACVLQATSAVDSEHAAVARARAEAFFGVAREGR